MQGGTVGFTDAPYDSSDSAHVPLYVAEEDRSLSGLLRIGFAMTGHRSHASMGQAESYLQRVMAAN